MKERPASPWGAAGRLCLFAFCLLPANPAAAAATEGCTAIESLRQSLSEQKRDRDGVQRDLQRIADDIRETRQDIGELQTRISTTEGRLQALRDSNAPLRERFNTESGKIAELLRLGQRLGPSEGLQLLLRSEKPEMLVRLRGYRDYLHHAREQQLGQYRQTFRKFLQAEEQQQSLVRDMHRQRQELQQRQAELQGYRSEQGEALQAYEGAIFELSQKLEQLLQTIDCEGRKTFFGATPFGEMRGRLALPVQGGVANRFGEPRLGGRLRWQGIRLRTTPGAPVRAVHDGKVIFADWFGDFFGLLLILDHGGDYMSLYANNQDLLHPLGARVRGGETVSTAGPGGNSEDDGVYFELRHKGRPINPAAWWR